jgi:pimeloyl-ACP methyl ester carboxylesterase
LRCIQPDVRLGDWSQFPRWARHFQDCGIGVDPNWELDCTLPLRLADKELSPRAKELAAEGFFVSVYSKRAMAKYRQLLGETSALEDFRNPTDLTRGEIRGVIQPAVLIYGTHSPFLPSGEALVDDIDNARLELIEGAGHNFPFNHPLRTFAVLQRSGGWNYGSPCDISAAAISQESRGNVPAASANERKG